MIMIVINQQYHNQYLGFLVEGSLAIVMLYRLRLTNIHEQEDEMSQSDKVVSKRTSNTVSEVCCYLWQICEQFESSRRSFDAVPRHVQIQITHRAA